MDGASGTEGQGGDQVERGSLMSTEERGGAQRSPGGQTQCDPLLGPVPGWGR